MSVEALQIVEERTEVKSKGERKGYTQLNTEFQRIAQTRRRSCLEIFSRKLKYQRNISSKDGENKDEKVKT